MLLNPIRLTALLLVALVAGCGGATETSDNETTGGTSGTGGSTTMGGSASFGGTSAIGSASSQGGATAGICWYDGVSYAAGTAFPAGDNCNTCSCSANGMVVCTLRACPIPNPAGCLYNGVYLAAGETVGAGDGCNTCTCDASSPTGTAAVNCTRTACVASCSYAGTMRANGTSFMATDGCNKCSCSNGNVLCTDMSCICNPAAEYWRSYTVTSAAQCEAVRFACPTNSAPFFNACGCGCEQSPDCPASFPCVDNSQIVYLSGSAGATGVSSGASTYAPGTGGTSSKIAVDVAPAAGGQAGVSLPIIICATPAQRAQCPLTAVPLL